MNRIEDTDIKGILTAWHQGEFMQDEAVRRVRQLFPQPLPDEALEQEFTTTLSFKLGEYLGKGLYHNYPDGFNTLIPELARELLGKAHTLLQQRVEEHYRIGHEDGEQVGYLKGCKQKDAEIEEATKELKEELRIGNILTANLTDKCGDLEHEVKEAKKQGGDKNC